ncbi:MAG: hypothetical protein F6K47_04635 [Symploca sp. SIO2E6]|nr:hypothetical protein [Symploca sp. SIO2E6]
MSAKPIKNHKIKNGEWGIGNGELGMGNWELVYLVPPYLPHLPISPSPPSSHLPY